MLILHPINSCLLFFLQERRLSRSNSRDQFSIATSPSSVDHNMNEMQALVASITPLPINLSPSSSGSKSPGESSESRTQDDSSSSSTVADISFTPEFEDSKLHHAADCPSSRFFADKPDKIAAQLQQRRIFDSAAGIDLHSIMSMELLEEENEVEDSTSAADIMQRIEIKSSDVISRVTEMSKIVSDAHLYLQKDETGERGSGDLGLKSNDSLLFIPRHDANEEFRCSPSADMMPSESEAESTPTNSPTHVPTEDPEALKKMCSSFGLHSPHVLMSSLQETESEDIEELLRQLQTSTSLPFEEDSLCLDPDIIDLTIIPPPASDDVDFCCVTPDSIDDSKTFLDQETGQRNELYVPPNKHKSMYLFVL